MKYLLIHGFNVSDSGAGSVATLIPDLTYHGIRTENFSYPWTFLFSLALRTEEAVSRLIQEVGNEPIGIIAHSHGCVIANEAAKRGVDVRHLVAIQPAMRRRTKFAACYRRVDVVYNEGDYTVEFARLWREIANAMPWRRQFKHQWGAMGRRGYEGDDTRVHELELDSELGHSGVFESKHTRRLVALRALMFRSTYPEFFYGDRRGG